MANPFDQFDDPTTIPAPAPTLQPTQQARDTDALGILKAERTGGRLTSQADADSLEREIQLQSKRAGVPYDNGGVKPIINTPNTPASPVNSPPTNPFDQFDNQPTIIAPPATPRSAVLKQPTTQQASLSQLADIGSTVMPFVRGALTGVTAGTAQPLAAGAIYGYNSLFGDGKMSWEDAKDAVGQQQQSDANTHPIAYGAGSLTGAGALGAATGGGSVMAQTGKNAAIGAVSAANASGGDVGQIVKGAVIGGTVGAISGKLQKVSEENLIGKISQDIKDGKYTLPDFAKIIAPVDGNGLVGAVKYEATNLSQNVKDLVTKLFDPTLAVGTAVAGAGVGAAHAAYTGGDIVDGAIKGAEAGGAVGFVNAKGKILGATAASAGRMAQYAGVMVPAIPHMATGVVTQGATNAYTVPSSTNPFDQFDSNGALPPQGPLDLLSALLRSKITSRFSQ